MKCTSDGLKIHPFSVHFLRNMIVRVMKDTLRYNLTHKLVYEIIVKCGNFDNFENVENLPIRCTVMKCWEEWYISTSRIYHPHAAEGCGHGTKPVPSSSDQYFTRITPVSCECWLVTRRRFYKHLKTKIILKKEIQFLHFFPDSGENNAGLFHAQTIQQNFRKTISCSSCIDFLNTP